MQFSILGPLEVTDGERTPSLSEGSSNACCWPCWLLHANRLVTPDQLRAELWGEKPPATASKSIQIYVSRHRKELDLGRRLTRGPGYLLRVSDDELDAGVFERLLAERRKEPNPGARRPQAARGACPVEGPGAGRPRLRIRRPGRDPAPRSAAPHCRARNGSKPTSPAGRGAELIGELEGPDRQSIRCASACAAN